MAGLGSRVLDADDKRELLLDASARVFCRLGYAGTTMNALAAGAGVTRPTIYAYYASKDDVFAALVDRVRREFLALQEEADVASLAETARSTLTTFLDAYIRHFWVLTILAHQGLSDPAMYRLQQEIHGRANRRHARFLARLRERGITGSVVAPGLMSEAVTGVVMRFAAEAFYEPQRQAELADALVALYLEWVGLAVVT